MDSVIFIPSKGRPECVTADYLRTIGYERWFIVLGNDDETIAEYEDKWTKDRCIVFDRPSAESVTDTMDAWGRSKGTGVSPARNEIVRMARDMGLSRCWLMDDDYKAMYERAKYGQWRKVTNGRELHKLLSDMEDFGEKAKIPVVGFGSTAGIGEVGSYGLHVWHCHNVSTKKEDFEKFSGRMFDDSVHTIKMAMHGRPDFMFHHMYVEFSDKMFIHSRKPGEQKGGMTDAYVESDDDDALTKKNVAECRNAGYQIVQHPLSATIRISEGGRRIKAVEHITRLDPKLISEGYRRQSEIVSSNGGMKTRVALVGWSLENKNGEFNGGTEVMNKIQIEYLLSRGYEVEYFCVNPLAAWAKERYQTTYGVYVNDANDLFDKRPLERYRPDLVFISTVLGSPHVRVLDEIHAQSGNAAMLFYSHGPNVSTRECFFDSDIAKDERVFFTYLNELDHERYSSHGVSEDRIRFVTNMYDIGDAKTLRTDYLYDVVSNARAVSQKGIANVSKLCSRMGFDTAFIGQGANGSTKHYAKIRKEMGSLGHYLGKVTRERVCEVVGRSRFLCFLPNAEEGKSPLVLLEAMALGTPVITWDRFGMRECVGGDLNIVLEHSDDFAGQFEREFAPRLEEYLKPEHRMAIMDYAKSRYGKDAYYSQLDKVIEMTMERGAKWRDHVRK